MEKKTHYWGGRDVELVRISSVPGFGDWLSHQTCPLVEDDPDPTDWAYTSDYNRFIEGKPVID